MSSLTPFKPEYVSLNKNIGVRVQGQDSVVVTFLASGKQTRFNVGNCTKVQYVYFLCSLRSPEKKECLQRGVCTQVSEPTPSLGREELMLQVSLLNARLALERLRWCLAVPTDRKWPRRCLRLPPALVSQGKRLLRLSSSVSMKDTDQAYIQHCLQDCQ